MVTQHANLRSRLRSNESTLRGVGRFTVIVPNSTTEVEWYQSKSDYNIVL